MEITDLITLVNNTDVLQVIADKVANAIPVNDLLVGGSNPFIPDYSSCETPVIGILS